MQKNTAVPNLAFLGPEGTYTHQAAYDRYGAAVQYIEQRTIAETFDALSAEIPFALIPQENSTFGSVVETYDLLRSPRIGLNVYIRDEVTLSIRHCLLGRKGVKLSSVDRVISHEQAIGQCSRFISTQLPGATVVKAPSTAAAAHAVLGDEGNGSAAICSKLCATLYSGLEVLCEGIQNEDGNYTRFWLLSVSTEIPLPASPTRSRLRRALIRIFVAPSTIHSPDISKCLAALQVSVVRIDRRPSLLPQPFHSIYFVELERHMENGYHKQKNDLCSEADWREEVEAALSRVRDLKCECVLIGTW